MTNPVDLSRAAELLATLGVPRRLDLLATAARLASGREECPLSALAAATGRSQRDLAKDLARLQECGLVSVRGGCVTADLTPLRTAAAAIDESLPVTRLLDTDPDLGRLFRHGRLRTWPENPSLLHRIARVAVRLLPRDEELSEAEVNARLSQLHPDHATVRRLLVDEGLVTRGASTAYRRVD